MRSVERLAPGVFGGLRLFGSSFFWHPAGLGVRILEFWGLGSREDVGFGVLGFRV